jgi:hypothetical protein
MLRLIVVLLLLANGLYFAWTQGHLALFGLAPAPQTEPARMAQQIKPEAIRLLNPGEAKPVDSTANPTSSASNASTTPAKPLECLQTPVLGERLAAVVRSALQSLPVDSWSMDSAEQAGRWIVYMGKYNDPEVLAKKKSELRRLDVTIDTLQNPKLEPGISLGGHTSAALANQELVVLNKRGVRTAKVVQEIVPAQGQILRLPAVDDTLRAQLEPVKTALGAVVLRTCN